MEESLRLEAWYLKDAPKLLQIRFPIKLVHHHKKISGRSTKTQYWNNCLWSSSIGIFRDLDKNVNLKPQLRTGSKCTEPESTLQQDPWWCECTLTSTLVLLLRAQGPPLSPRVPLWFLGQLSCLHLSVWALIQNHSREKLSKSYPALTPLARFCILPEQENDNNYAHNNNSEEIRNGRIMFRKVW